MKFFKKKNSYAGKVTLFPIFIWLNLFFVLNPILIETQPKVDENFIILNYQKRDNLNSFRFLKG